MAMKRNASEGSIHAAQSIVNRNVDFFSSPWFMISYVLGIALFRFVIFVFAQSFLTPTEQWTITFVIHGLITFYGLHWTRGTPFWEDQGEHIEETVYEQLDSGVPWTTARKFLIIVPIVLFMISAHYSEYNSTHTFVNLVVLAILIAAKLPEMHGVRLFGVNSGKVD